MHSFWILIYVSMYLYSYLSTHGISGLAARGDWEQFEVCLKMTIKWTQRYTPTPWSSEFGDVIGDQDWVNSEMHWEAVIVWVWRCTLRPWWSEFGDEIEDRDWLNSEIHWEPMIERVWTCTWRPRSRELRDTLRAVIERVSRYTCSRLLSREIREVLGGGRSRGGQWEARQVLSLYSSVS